MRFATRDAETFWMTYHYAEELKKDAKRKHGATVVRWIKREAGIAIVVFEETALETKVKVDKHVSLGDRVNLRIQEADAFRDRLSFVHVMDKKRRR